MKRQFSLTVDHPVPSTSKADATVQQNADNKLKGDMAKKLMLEKDQMKMDQDKKENCEKGSALGAADGETKDENKVAESSVEEVLDEQANGDLGKNTANNPTLQISATSGCQPAADPDVQSGDATAEIKACSAAPQDDDGIENNASNLGASGKESGCFAGAVGVVDAENDLSQQANDAVQEIGMANAVAVGLLPAVEEVNNAASGESDHAAGPQGNNGLGGDDSVADLKVNNGIGMAHNVNALEINNNEEILHNEAGHGIIDGVEIPDNVANVEGHEVGMNNVADLQEEANNVAGLEVLGNAEVGLEEAADVAIPDQPIINPNDHFGDYQAADLQHFNEAAVLAAAINNDADDLAAVNGNNAPPAQPAQQPANDDNPDMNILGAMIPAQFGMFNAFGGHGAGHHMLHGFGPDPLPENVALHNLLQQVEEQVAVQARNPAQCKFDSLPDNVVMQILSHMKGKSLLNSYRLVCKRWLMLARDWKVWQDKELLQPNTDEELDALTLYTSGIEKLAIMSNELSKSTVINAIERSPRLAQLVLHPCKFLRSDVFSTIASSCPFMEHIGLYLSSPTSTINSAKFTALAEMDCLTKLTIVCLFSNPDKGIYDTVKGMMGYCLHITCLRLNHCLLLDDDFLEHICDSMILLQELRLTLCGTFTPGGISDISKLQNLRALELTFNQPLTCVNAGSLSNIAHGCINMEVLDLTACAAVTDDVLMLLVENMNFLQHLILESTKVTTSIYPCIEKFCPHLIELNVGNTSASRSPTHGAMVNVENRMKENAKKHARSRFVNYKDDVMMNDNLLRFFRCGSDGHMTWDHDKVAHNYE